MSEVTGPDGSEAAAPSHPSDLPTPGQHHTSSLWKLTLGSIGVVYGDIGTSPIYAMRESLHATSRDSLTRPDVLGMISLLIWALIRIVMAKYVVLVTFSRTMHARVDLLTALETLPTSVTQ
jgi:KUP system potassium uptake protein